MGRSCSRVIVRWQVAVLLIWFERPGNARIFGPSQRSCQSMCGNSLCAGLCSVLLGIIGQGEQRKTPQNLMVSRGVNSNCKCTGEGVIKNLSGSLVV